MLIVFCNLWIENGSQPEGQDPPEGSQEEGSESLWGY